MILHLEELYATISMILDLIQSLHPVRSRLHFLFLPTIFSVLVVCVESKQASCPCS